MDVTTATTRACSEGAPRTCAAHSRSVVSEQQITITPESQSSTMHIDSQSGSQARIPQHVEAWSVSETPPRGNVGRNNWRSRSASSERSANMRHRRSRVQGRGSTGRVTRAVGSWQLPARRNAHPACARYRRETVAAGSSPFPRPTRRAGSYSAAMATASRESRPRRCRPWWRRGYMNSRARSSAAAVPG
jgi:hypothetical protein